MTISRQDLLEVEKKYFPDDEGYESILEKLKGHYNSNFVKGYKRGYEQCKKDIEKRLQKEIDDFYNKLYEESKNERD